MDWFCQGMLKYSAVVNGMVCKGISKYSAVIKAWFCQGICKYSAVVNGRVLTSMYFIWLLDISKWHCFMESV